MRPDSVARPRRRRRSGSRPPRGPIHRPPDRPGPRRRSPSPTNQAPRRCAAAEQPAGRRQDARDRLGGAVLQPLGQTGPAGPIEDTPYDPTGTAGPSSRFYDFIDGAQLMQRGYRFVMVDLRGFGGCRAAWTGAGRASRPTSRPRSSGRASQPWSSGHVGMYGKSYDGVTGLMGVAQAGRPRRGRLAGAGLRHVPLPVLQPRAVLELVADARALQRHRPDPARSRTTRATTSTARTTRRGRGATR